MKDLTLVNCSTDGTNVTDSRDGKSYTVKKLESNDVSFCYMLSNLRLDGGTILDTATSNVSAEYALPADTGESGWANDYCKPYMASKGGEYYYNWSAATARVNDMVGISSCSNDTDNSVGDICPFGWRLPNRNDIAEMLWNGGNNPGFLANFGRFDVYQHDVGNVGRWWFDNRYSSTYAQYLRLNGASISINLDGDKKWGYSVRCMRSS